jgi:hypothetical protein
MPTNRPRVPWLGLLFRWLVGMGLVTWRYVWATTPLHRTESRVPSSAEHSPPPLPTTVSRANVQLPADGYGPLFHRSYRVHISRPRLSPAELVEEVRRDFGRFVPKEVVKIHADDHQKVAAVGDEFVVDMPGPWNGPVRVIAADATTLRLATLVGHLEAGVIEFRARAQDGGLLFEIESWACARSRTVHLLYDKLKLAKEIQFNMWARFCLAAAKFTGGRPTDGVQAHTVKVIGSP